MRHGKASIATDHPIGQRDARPVEVPVVGEVAAGGGEGVEKCEDHRGGAAGGADQGPGAGRVGCGLHYARILTDVDDGSGGQLQP